MRILKTIILFLAIWISEQSFCQIHDFSCPQLLNPSYMGTVEDLSFYLSGEYSMLGFEGAPKEVAFNTTIPVIQNKKNSYRNRYEKDAKKMHLGLSVLGKQQGARSDYNILGNYSYGLKLSKTVDLAFGLGIGMDYSGLNLSKLGDDAALDPLLRDNSSVNFQSVFGMTLISKGFYSSLFTPSFIGKDRSISLQVGYIHQKMENEYAYTYDDSKLGRSFEIHARTNYNLYRKRTEVQLSGMCYLGNTLGLGLSWENPKSLSGLVSVCINVIRIGYSYKITDSHLNASSHQLSLNISINQLEIN